MRRLITAEFHKLATTRLWLWLLLGSVALTALYASLAIAFGDSPDNPTPPLASPGGRRTVFSVGQGAGTLLAVLAAIGLTGEFRHQTATTTFLATPNRGQVVLAKLATYALVGIGYALVCIAITVVIALPWLDAKGIQVPLTGNGIPATLAGVVAAVAIFGSSDADGLKAIQSARRPLMSPPASGSSVFILIITSAKASSVSLLSVSVGSIMRASGTMSGK